jgi:virulence factor Mce-like protein
MITRRVTAALDSSRALFLITLFAASLCCVGFLGVGGTEHTITAEFSNVDGLVVGNEVRIAGVVAGTVQSVQFNNAAGVGTAFARVDMSIDPAYWPLHDGTKVAVKPKGVLSNVFVAISPGPEQGPSLGNHPQFALKDTQSPVNLDALSNVFTPNVREAIRTQLQEGVLAFGAGGALALNQTLANLNPLTNDAISVTDVLATRSPQLDSLNNEFDTVTGMLAREDSNLRPLVANLDTALSAFAVRENNLQGTLTHAASVFGDLAQALSSPSTQADLARIFEIGPQSLSCATAISDNLTSLVTAVNPYISYKRPFTLDDLLNNFVTATGYNGGTNPPYGLTVDGADALRAYLYYPLPAGYSWHDTGGLSQEHAGYTNAKVNGTPVYAEQPPLTGASHYPTLSGCTPPAGLP